MNIDIQLVFCTILLLNHIMDIQTNLAFIDGQNLHLGTRS